MRTLTSLAVIALFSLGATRCTPDEPWSSPNPDYALRAFLSALDTGDHDTAWEFLGPETRRTLVTAVRLQQKALGEPSVVQPHAGLLGSLCIVDSPSTLEISRLEVLERSQDLARVAIHSVFGTTIQVEMSFLDGRWSLELLPSPDRSVD